MKSEKKNDRKSNSRRSMGLDTNKEFETAKLPFKSELRKPLPAITEPSVPQPTNSMEKFEAACERIVQLQEMLLAKRRLSSVLEEQVNTMKNINLAIAKCYQPAAEDRLHLIDSRSEAYQCTRQTKEFVGDRLDKLNSKHSKLVAYNAELLNSNANMESFRQEMAAKHHQQRKLLEKKTALLNEKIAERVKIKAKIQKVQNERKLVQPNVTSSRLHVCILRMQTMKNLQLLWHYTDVKMPEESVFDYFSPKKEVSKRVEVQEMVYYVTSLLYPRMSTLLTKICYQSRMYEVLLLGDVDKSLTEELRGKIGANSEVEVKRSEASSRLVKQLIILASSTQVNTFVNDFRTKLAEHLMSFNNDIIRVCYLNFLAVKEGLEEIRIVYMLGQIETTRSVYLLQVKSPPTIEQLQSLVDRKKRSDLSDLIDDLGERKTYFVMDIPENIHKSEEKVYMDAIEFVRKHK